MTALPVVLDWDGTATREDTLHMVLSRFGDLRVFDLLEERIGRQLTLHEVIAAEMETVSAPLGDVVEWLVEHVVVRPGLGELVARHDPLIVSAGFRELIEPVLRREGLAPRLVANTIDARKDGWRARFRSTEPCPVCGEPCKRAAVAGLGAFVYVGDGISDRCVALSAAHVFARAGLAEWLDREGVAYSPFETLHDVRT